MARTYSKKPADTNNSTMPSLRRSQRTRKTHTTISPDNQAVRRSARIANRSLSRTQQQERVNKQSHSSSTHQESHDSSAATKKTPTVRSLNATRRRYPRVFSYIDDTASESGSTSPASTAGYSSNTNLDSEDEPKHVSTDNLRSAASDAIDYSRENHKSWWEAENNEYELDEFVVWDGKVDEEKDEEEGGVERKYSFSSISSEDTLFVPEIKITKRERTDEHEPEDVAEQISDGIVLFSRRCNRDRDPVALRVTKRIRRGIEVAVVWERAVRLGLGASTEMSDGSVVWRIGPKVVNNVL